MICFCLFKTYFSFSNFESLIHSLIQDWQHVFLLSGGILIEDAARHLGSFVRKLSNDELRVTQMQGIFDSLSYTKTETLISAKLDSIVRSLGAKFRRYGAILTTNQAAVKVGYFQKESPFFFAE